jgi:hypothetical protein
VHEYVSLQDIFITTTRILFEIFAPINLEIHCAFFMLFPGFPQLSSFQAFQLSSFPAAFQLSFPVSFQLSSFPGFPSAFLMASSFVPTTVSRLYDNS